jgi:hypothetical protein
MDERASTPSTKHSHLSAAQTAFEIFCKEMCSAEEAFQMLLWVLYRAAQSTKEVPQTVSYYVTVKASFLEQHPCDYPVVLAEAALDRFNEHASFFAERTPDLIAWLKEQWQEVQAHRADHPDAELEALCRRTTQKRAARAVA